MTQDPTGVRLGTDATFSSSDARAVGLAFTVYGVASGMGSKRAFQPKGFKAPIITDSNRNLKSWQQLVADGASRAILDTPSFSLLAGPVRLTLAFYLPRPKAIRNRVVPHCKMPDCSKLIRSTEDALSGVVYVDDSQVVEIIAGKFYALPGDPPHVDVRVELTNGVDRARVPAAPLSLFAEAAS